MLSLFVHVICPQNILYLAITQKEVIVPDSIQIGKYRMFEIMIFQNI